MSIETFTTTPMDQLSPAMQDFIKRLRETINNNRGLKWHEIFNALANAFAQASVNLGITKEMVLSLMDVAMDSHEAQKRKFEGVETKAVAS